MSIVETIGRAIAEDDPVVFGALTPDEMGSTVRAALRAIKPEDVSAAQLEAFTRIMPAHYLPKSKYADDLRRALAAAIAAGAEQ